MISCARKYEVVKTGLLSNTMIVRRLENIESLWSQTVARIVSVVILEAPQEAYGDKNKIFNIPEVTNQSIMGDTLFLFS